MDNSVNPDYEHLLQRDSELRHEDYSRCAKWPVIYIRKLTDSPEDRSLRMGASIHSMELIHHIFPSDALKDSREKLAKMGLASLCKDIGLQYTEEDKTWNGFPDGLAVINGKEFNVEATSVTPLTTSGVTVMEYMRLMGEGHISQPSLAPVRQCVTKPCQASVPIGPVRWYVTDRHPRKHKYFEVWPPHLIEDFFTEIAHQFGPFETPLIFAPQLDHTKSMFVSQVKVALEKKAAIISKQGKGRKNCVVVLTEGLIPSVEWLKEIPIEAYGSIDSIVLVSLDGYLGMIHNHNPVKKGCVYALKCGFCQDKACSLHASRGAFSEFGMVAEALPHILDGKVTPQEQINALLRTRLDDMPT